MANVVVEQVYNKLLDMEFSFFKPKKENARIKDIVVFGLEDENTTRLAMVHLNTNSIKIIDLEGINKKAAPYEIEGIFEIFKGSWHDFLEWEC